MITPDPDPTIPVSPEPSPMNNPTNEDALTVPPTLSLLVGNVVPIPTLPYNL